MKRTDKVISRWSTLIDDFSTSGQEFYRAVEAAVHERKIPGFTYSRIDFKEGGFASSKRTYLRIESNSVAFDICAAPYGDSYFFSWWLSRLGPRHPFLYFLGVLIVVLGGGYYTASDLLGEEFIIALVLAPIVLLALLGFMARARLFGPEENILMIPILGWLYEKVFSPITYYSLDTALMFQETVRRAINETINNLLTEQGLKALTESDFEPTIRSLVQ